ncbi:MAG: hypothetical protein ACLU9S_02075 [Oscillospiraceae bacterium]
MEKDYGVVLFGDTPEDADQKKQELEHCNLMLMSMWRETILVFTI